MSLVLNSESVLNPIWHDIVILCTNLQSACSYILVYNVIRNYISQGVFNLMLLFSNHALQWQILFLKSFSLWLFHLRTINISYSLLVRMWMQNVNEYRFVSALLLHCLKLHACGSGRFWRDGFGSELFYEVLDPDLDPGQLLSESSSCHIEFYIVRY